MMTGGAASHVSIMTDHVPVGAFKKLRSDRPVAPQVLRNPSCNRPAKISSPPYPTITINRPGITPSPFRPRLTTEGLRKETRIGRLSMLFCQMKPACTSIEEWEGFSSMRVGSLQLFLIQKSSFYKIALSETAVGRTP